MVSTAAQSVSPPSGARPADVEANLTFIVPQDTKPYFNSSELTGGVPELFFETEQHPVTIHDMRAADAELSLDKQGFELHRWPTAVDDLYDDLKIEAEYEREIMTLLREVTRADRVAIFDRTRRSDAPDGAANPDGFRGSVDRLHVDYTVASGPKRAADAMGEAEVSRILGSGGHLVEINVWRPISGPVQRSPLVVGDASSISPEELIATEQIFSNRVGEIYLIAHAPSQRWYWAPSMERDEVLLIKGWDSREDGRARFTPHSAFRIPNQDPSAPPRESIEVRAYAVFES
jgi:hypothetical protein